MRTVTTQVRKEIAAREDTWIEEAYSIAQDLWAALGRKGDGKEGQLRNIQSVAEESNSWEAVALFIRYQAARGQVPKKWAEDTVSRLEKLREQAKELASHSQGADEKSVHMEIVSRVLGYAVRWHVWDVKKQGGNP